MAKLKEETFVITRAWLNSAVDDLQGRINRKEISSGSFQPVADELKRIRATWLNEQAGDGNV